MAEVAVVNSDGKEVGKMSLSADMFEVEPHAGLVHRAVVAHLANSRAGTVDTKTRDEVSGGGRKPWRQKGTGRARQGSIRAPHWTGGGVVFGPHPRDFGQDLPKKMRRRALKSALSAKLSEGKITVVDQIEMDSVSTKRLIGLLEAIGVQGKTMLVLAEPSETVLKSSRNVPWLVVRVSPALSTYDVLNADTVLFVRDAVAKLEEVYTR